MFSLLRGYVNTMRIVSLNVSEVKTIHWKNRTVETGIFKTPVDGSVIIRKMNLEGDRQADLTVHGGQDKAVYAYDIVDYNFWTTELNRQLPFGMFGENLTTEDLLTGKSRLEMSFALAA